MSFTAGRACEAGANEFIEKHFHDCVYSLWDGVGFFMGISSILVWLLAQLPQFISNIKNQSAEALSVWFLAQWFAGDTLNLLGCLIQGQQLPTTTFLAMYFVLSDMVMLLQYIYYGALQARKKRLRKKAKSLRYQRTLEQASLVAAAKLLEPLLVESEAQIPEGEPHPHVLPHSEHHKPHTPPPSPPPGQAPPPCPAPPQPMHELAAQEESLAVPSHHHQPAPGVGPLVLIALLLTSVALVGTSSSSMQSDAAAGHQDVGRRLRFSTDLQPSLSGMGTHNRWLLSHEDPLAQDPSLASEREHFRSWCSYAGAPLLCWLSPWKPKSTLEGLALEKSDDGSAAVDGDVPEMAAPPYEPDEPAPENWWESIRIIAGTLCGYASCIMYLSSRVSQVAKNMARKSAEGLAPLMFLMALTANMFTGLSILLRLHSWVEGYDQMPWIFGAFGTVALDVFIFYQTRAYANPPPHPHHHHHHHHHRHSLDGSSSLPTHLGGELIAEKRTAKSCHSEAPF